MQTKHNPKGVLFLKSGYLRHFHWREPALKYYNFIKTCLLFLNMKWLCVNLRNDTYFISETGALKRYLKLKRYLETELCLFCAVMFHSWASRAMEYDVLLLFFVITQNLALFLGDGGFIYRLLGKYNVGIAAHMLERFVNLRSFQEHVCMYLLIWKNLCYNTLLSLFVFFRVTLGSP